MDSKDAFCSVLCKQAWRAFLSQHSIKTHPLGCAEDANEVPGELTFSEGQLAAFTTLHLGILQQIQPCFVPQLSATCKRRDSAHRCRRRWQGSYFVLKMSVLALRLNIVREGDLQGHSGTLQCDGLQLYQNNKKRRVKRQSGEEKRRKLINKSPAICGLWPGFPSPGWLVGKLSVQESTPDVVCVSFC